jgi:hypothetical protein
MLLDHLSGQRTQVRVPPLFNEGGGFHELLILEQAWRIASKVTEPKGKGSSSYLLTLDWFKNVYIISSCFESKKIITTWGEL